MLMAILLIVPFGQTIRASRLTSGERSYQDSLSCAIQRSSITAAMKRASLKQCLPATANQIPSANLLRRYLSHPSTFLAQIINTYTFRLSNGLKDIANDLGFRWSEPQHRA